MRGGLNYGIDFTGGTVVYRQISANAEFGPDPRFPEIGIGDAAADSEL